MEINGMAWNYNQTALLREQHGKIPSAAIASLLGKSPNAIIEKANKMGLSSNLYHTVEVPLYSVINFRDEGYCAGRLGRLVEYSHKGLSWVEHQYTVARDSG
jgi:hypothetical protein|tara:strand:+ start:228 stop:533 length:306 start_codon:yes stop_codon:yes gene_type:complete